MTAENSLDYDVIVVGAGPAGAVAAFHLAEHSMRVLLIDRQSFPRYKPCGGGIPMHTIAQIPFDIKPVLEFCSEGGMVTFRGETRLKVPLADEFAWLGMRDKLDLFLLEKAREAGADWLQGVRVTDVEESDRLVKIHTADRDFSARFLIGADGVNSIIAQSLDLVPNRKTGTALEAEIAVPAGALLEHGRYPSFDFGVVPGGYGWVFPKKDHLSVGVFQANGSKAQNIREHLQQYIHKLPVLRQHEILHLQGHRIPLGEKDGPLHTRRCLLVGDAANLADPWLGEGIYYAVRSAVLASQVLVQAAHTDSPDLATYTRQIHAEIMQDLSYAKRIANLIYRHPALGTQMISRSRAMQQDVFKTIRGDLTFRQLWTRLVLRSPIILTQFLFSKGESLS